MFKKETKTCSDFLCDGILSYGVCIGRFEFSNNQTVYAISDLVHFQVDVEMYWQLSFEEYTYLKQLSSPKIPSPPVDVAITNAYHRNRFLCGESSLCKRTKFSLSDIRR